MDYKAKNATFHHRQQAVRELSIILIAATIIAVIEYRFDIFETVQAWEQQAGAKWLDETLMVATFLGVAFAFFSYRRWSEVQMEVQVRQHAEAELQIANLKLEQANRAKDEFLAGMSHELRTPLNSILGMSEILLEQQRDPLSEKQQKYIYLIESSGRHLLSLINDILDLSKIEAGQPDLYPEIVDVKELCQSSLVFVEGAARKKSIRVLYNECEPGLRIYADPRRLKQIVINLLINAVKFTPEHGQVTLDVDAAAEEDVIQFSVIDTGIGIAQDDIERLFQSFVQVDSKLNREYEGTGLGLTLVQRLTELHGGTVHVESEVGRGSTFRIRLPWRKDLVIQQAAEEESKEPLPRSALESGSGSAETTSDRAVILLAEDNEINIMMIKDYLESQEYRVEVAQNGVEALNMAVEQNPDIILMDIQMPVMDGLDTIRRLRALPQFESTPIIALTALAMPDDRERCISAGANEYVSKPLNMRQLVEMIDEFISLSK